MHQDLEKRKAKTPTPLMELKLSNILEGMAQAHKRARYLYIKRVKDLRSKSLPPPY